MQGRENQYRETWGFSGCRVCETVKILVRYLGNLHKQAGSLAEPASYVGLCNLFMACIRKIKLAVKQLYMSVWLLMVHPAD